MEQVSTMIYAFTDTGTTKKAAEMLKDLLGGDALVEENPSRILEGFSSYVLGTNVHFGRLNRRFRRFLKRWDETLRGANVCIFLVGARSEESEKYLALARKLAPYAAEIRFVWGELNRTGNAFQRFFIDCLIEGRRDDKLPRPRLLEKELRALAETVSAFRR